MVFASIPSPSTGVIHLGPLPLRGYAFMIILGVVAAVYVTGRRLRARGADPKLAGDAAVPAVLLGIVGARIYHVVSSPHDYFGVEGNLVDALKIWEGGLSIWGGVAGGAFGAWLACRRAGVSFALFADAVAPGLALAQAVGRWGNWFNQELYGRPTNLPWAVEIDGRHLPTDVEGDLIPEFIDDSRFHPTFLYESLWNLGVVGVLLLVDRRRRLGRGKLFVLYVALYTAGRVWIEALRIDTAEDIFGLRVNIWVSLLLFVAAVVVLFAVRRPLSAAGRVDVGGPEADGGEVGSKDDAGAAKDGGPVEPAGAAKAKERKREKEKDPATAGGSAEPAGAAKVAGRTDGDGSNEAGGEAEAKGAGLTGDVILEKNVGEMKGVGSAREAAPAGAQSTSEANGGAEACNEPPVEQRAAASAQIVGAPVTSADGNAAKAR